MSYIIVPSKAKNKKYAAIVTDSHGKKKTVNFGDSRFEQYRDSTNIGKYANKDHSDIKRRENYYKRHGKDAVKYSAKWFSHKYLW